MWLRSEKIPACGEGLSDEGFENCDRSFTFLNIVRCPRILRNRDYKQYDIIELITKGKCCKLRCTSEVTFTFLENVYTVKNHAPQ